MWFVESNEGEASEGRTQLATGPVAPCVRVPGGAKLSPGSDGPGSGSYNGPGNRD
ncbi:hypothetical protein GCM10010191_04680 [Actinomadura vinacea]|uniref:Uncharacterized protein n=1 Tax=Actinomadura vinacea TaxID=115336 RepID=A0ABN3IE85_9ACTN